MLIESHNNPFPRRSDVETLLEDGSYKEIVSIFAEQGVFLLGRKQIMPDLMTRFAFGEDFYERVFSTLSKATYGISITGLRVSMPSGINLLTFLQEQIESQQPEHKYEPKITQVFEQSKNVFAITCVARRVSFLKISGYPRSSFLSQLFSFLARLCCFHVVSLPYSGLFLPD